jgi:putative transposase
LPRDGATVVEQVWPALRQRDPPQADQPYARLSPLEVAPRRDVRDPKGGEANLNGEMVYLWRAVDQEGEILESFVTKKRDKAAALSFMKRALKRHGRAEKIVVDGLRSYPAAMRELGNLDRREMGRWKNNRAENSHLPFRRRERAMLRFRRMKTLQKFVSVHASLHNHFNSERHLVDRQTYRTRRSAALAEWQSLAS